MSAPARVVVPGEFAAPDGAGAAADADGADVVEAVFGPVADAGPEAVAAPADPAAAVSAAGGWPEAGVDGAAGEAAPPGSTIEDAVAFRSMVVGWRNDLPAVDLPSLPVEPPAAPPAPGEPFPVEELSVIVRRSP